MGGPKDTIPPSLILSYPVHQTLNYKESTLTLTFDEFINADKLKQKMIITPTMKGNYKQIVKKEILELEFEEPFEDSTTYTLNFFDGITDITEKNPAENLIIAFSTTSYIDSLSISGFVNDLFTGEPTRKMTVGLYNITDSLDIYSTQPTYFLTTNEEGYFHIQNMKKSKYLLIGFADENRNLKFDPDTEAYTFSSDTITPQFIPDTLTLSTIKVNAAELKLVNAKPSGKNFDIRYTKPISRYQIEFPDTTRTLHHKLVDEKDVIRIYNTLNLLNDSLQVILQSFDSLKNRKLDTVYVKFRESSKQSGNFEYSTLPGKGSALKQNEPVILSFNKPILQHTLDIVQLKLDTLTIPYSLKKPDFSSQISTITLNLPSPQEYTSLIDTLLANRMTYKDSTDSVYTSRLSQLPKDRFRITIPPKTFISAENDTLGPIDLEYKYAKAEEYGIIKFLINTNKSSYTVQLIDKKLQTIKTLPSCTSCLFTQVAPGDYSIRILNDNNGDGLWSIGNIREWKAPESVYIHSEFTTLRANWTVEVSVDY